MDGINLVDVGAVILVLISAILAYSRGLSRESLSIIGWVGSAIIAYLFAPQVAPLISELPIVGDFIDGNCELGILAGFAVLFAICLIIASIFTPLFSNIIANSALGPIDKGLGLVFGILRGALLIAVALALYGGLVADKENFQLVEDSTTKKLFAGTETTIEKNIPEDAPNWFGSRYSKLTKSCNVENAEPMATDG